MQESTSLTGQEIGDREQLTKTVRTCSVTEVRETDRARDWQAEDYDELFRGACFSQFSKPVGLFVRQVFPIGNIGPFPRQSISAAKALDIFRKGLAVLLLVTLYSLCDFIHRQFGINDLDRVTARYLKSTAGNGTQLGSDRSPLALGRGGILSSPSRHKEDHEMTNDEVERAIEFLLKWQAEFNLKLDKLVDSNERVSKLTEELVADRQRIVQLIELQSSRLDRQDLWWKDHEDRIRRLEPES